MPSEETDAAFCVLGPFELRVGDRAVPVRSPKHRIVLATLLLHAGSPVANRELAVAVWGAHQPESPRRAIQVIITRLRALLGGDLVVTGADGYQLDVADDRFDLGRFRQLLVVADRAAKRSDPERESAALRAALDQWRGEPLVDVPSDLLQRESVPRLHEQRLHALERRFDADLRLGRHRELIGELVQATAQQPLRESLWAQLMTALHRSGRRADALAAYHAGRRHLAEELGIDPGEQLRRLHATILGTPRPEGAATLAAVPRQLPPEASAFTGRAREIARLDGILADHETPDPTGPPMIVVVSGTAGVGKTALAVHWTRRMADRFPDGQLWVDLHGYDHRPMMTPGQALTIFLRALGVPGPGIPSDVESQSGLYRSLMDGRRALVVVDNAGAAEQVRPLLPGSHGNVVLVTSRSRLTGLVAANGAHAMVLNLFTESESRELLARRIGGGRIGAEPAAVREIVQRCARLPLALAVAAARAAQRPGEALESLAAQLRDARDRLDEFAGPDPATDARAVFSWSYRTLGEPAARLFRLLGMHPGPDVPAEVVPDLAGLPAAATRPLLEELTAAHLVTERTAGRYALHDLMRAYAVELAHAVDSADERRAALGRALDHYLHAAHAAATLLDPLRDPIRIAGAAPTRRPHAPANRDAALAWCEAEYAVLQAAIERAFRAGFDDHAWQLVWALADFQQWRGLWPDRAASLRTALEAARRLDNRAEQARAHRGLGYAYTRLFRDDDAHIHLRHALELYLALGDAVGQARSHHGLSYVLERQGNPRAALWHAERALDLYPPDGGAHRARAMGAVGWCHTQLGHYELALRYCTEAVTLLQATGDRIGESANLDSLGYAHHHLGHYPEAVRHYETALRMRRELGHRYGEANTLMHLGDTHLAVGHPAAARRAWQNSLHLLDQLGEPDAELVRVKLDTLRT